jgi:hypothetical protein
MEKARLADMRSRFIGTSKLTKKKKKDTELTRLKGGENRGKSA